MTTKKTTKKRSKRAPAKQIAMPGTKRKVDKKLDALAEEYEEARDQRIAHGQEEVAAKNKLIEHMKTKGVSAYNNGELEVTLSVKDPTENVKVKRIENAAEEAAE